MDYSVIELDEDQLFEEEWLQLVARAQQQNHRTPTISEDKRGKQPAVPESPNLYLNRAQQASIGKLENFGWELFFIRRAVPAEILVVMHLPRSGETAIIEKDGTVNRMHGLATRADA